MGQASSQASSVQYECRICRYTTSNPTASELGTARGNTTRFRGTVFQLWQCPHCQTIYAVDPVDFADIYKDYPLNKRRLDIFARHTLRNLLGRLVSAGLKRTDAILDYGCGNGILLQYLRFKGYPNVRGYDPFVEEYSTAPVSMFDCVIANDVIEHCPSPRELIADCLSKLRPGGILYIGTADATGVRMDKLEPHIMRLHLPFHRIILTQKSLHGLASEFPVEMVCSFTRSYMDTLYPFANYRFLDEFNKALDHEMDRAFDPSSTKLILQTPSLFFFAFFGYFLPSAHEPAILVKTP